MLNQPTTKCDKCRRAKKKCVPLSAGSEQCERCRSLNTECPGRPVSTDPDSDAGTPAIVKADLSRQELTKPPVRDGPHIKQEHDESTQALPGDGKVILAKSAGLIKRVEGEKTVENSSSPKNKRIAEANALALTKRNTDKFTAKLNDLKRFSSAFHVDKPIPKDILPILAKDPKRQEQILRTKQAYLNALASKHVVDGSTKPRVVVASGKKSITITSNSALFFFGPRKVKAASEKLDMAQNFNTIEMLQTSAKAGLVPPGCLSHKYVNNGCIQDAWKTSPRWTALNEENQEKSWETRFAEVSGLVRTTVSPRPSNAAEAREIDQDDTSRQLTHTLPDRPPIRSPSPIPRPTLLERPLESWNSSNTSFNQTTGYSGMPYPQFGSLPNSSGGVIGSLLLNTGLSSLANNAQADAGHWNRSMTTAHRAAFNVTQPGLYDRHGAVSAQNEDLTPLKFNYSELSKVRAWLEYYLSAIHLSQSMFLRQNMDSSGFIPVDVIASLPELKSFLGTQKYAENLLRVAAYACPTLQIILDTEIRQHARPKTGWEPFVLPYDNRQPSARRLRPTGYSDLGQYHIPLQLHHGTKVPYRPLIPQSPTILASQSASHLSPFEEIMQVPWMASADHYGSNSNESTYPYGGVSPYVASSQRDLASHDYILPAFSYQPPSDKDVYEAYPPPQVGHYPPLNYFASLTNSEIPHNFGSTTISGNARAILGSVHNVYNEPTPGAIQTAVEKVLSSLTEQGVLPKVPVQKARDEVAHWVRQVIEAQMCATTIWDGESAIVPPSLGTSMAHLEPRHHISGSPTLSATSGLGSPPLALTPESTPKPRYSAMSRELADIAGIW